MLDRSTDTDTSARTIVHLLRHGLVDNPDGILYGRLPDFHLAANGHLMARRLAEHLTDHDIAYLAASPLERAQETAEPLAMTLGRDVVIDPRLIEPSNAFEGTQFGVGDGALKRPSNWKKVTDPFTPSWGEPYIKIARRMLGAIYTAVQEGAGHEAVLVSHQLPIWTIRRYLEGKRLWHNPAHRQCSLASLTTLIFDRGVLTGMRYSEPAADLQPESSAGAKGA